MLGEEESVGARAKLAETTAQGTSLFCIKGLPGCNSENNYATTMGSSGEERPPPQVVKHSMLLPYTLNELVDMRILFWQKPPEPLPTWLLCLRDMGMENIVMLGSEMGMKGRDN